MMITHKFMKIGRYLWMALPRKVLAQPGDTEFVRQSQAAESILKRYRNAFRELAK